MKKSQSVLKTEVNTKSGVIILVIVLTVGLGVYWLGLKKVERVERKELKQSENQRQMTEETIKNIETDEEINTDNWKTCLNKVSNYEFKYPGNWLIVDNYLNVLADCYNLEKPRFSNFFIGSDPYQSGDRFNIHIETQDSLKGTASEGITSLDEYYSRHEESLSMHKVTEVIVDGERADLLLNEKDNHLNAWFFHEKNFYMISSTLNDVNLLKTILKTFKFPNK